MAWSCDAERIKHAIYGYQNQWRSGVESLITPLQLGFDNKEPLSDHFDDDRFKDVGFFKKKPMQRSAAIRATSEAYLF